MPSAQPTPHGCAQCTERAGLGVLEWARTTWWRRLTRRPPAVVLHVHVHDKAALEREISKQLRHSTTYKPFPR